MVLSTAYGLMGEQALVQTVEALEGVEPDDLPQTR